MTIKPDLAVAIGETPVKRVDLVRILDAMADASKDRFIFLRADRAVPYGELMSVLEILRAGGYAKIKLVALEARSGRRAKPEEKRPTGMTELDTRTKDFAAVVGHGRHRCARASHRRRGVGGGASGERRTGGLPGRPGD